MTPASLTPALFTAPVPSSASSSALGISVDASAASSTNTASNGGFARLLQAEPANAVANDSAPVLADAEAIDPLLALDDLADSDAVLEDAPWPPAGLEQMLAAPVAAAIAPASLNAGLAGAPQPAAMQPANAPSPAPLDAAAGSTGGVPSLPTATAAPSLLPATGTAGTPADLPQQAAADAAISVDGLKAAGMELVKTGVNAPAPAADAGSFAPMMALAATSAAAPLPAADTQASVLPTSADMGGEHFDQDVAQGVEYMLDHKLQSARIRVSPQQMGMIEVELRLEGERVHAHFSSAHADVRQALNDSLPRLRELLDAQGLQMGQAGVGKQSAQDAGDAQHQGGGRHPGASSDSVAADVQAAPVWRRAGLLDAYA